jgi:hypothetical protein
LRAFRPALFEVRDGDHRFSNMVTIRSQRQAAGPSYLRIAKRAATL